MFTAYVINGSFIHLVLVPYRVHGQTRGFKSNNPCIIYDLGVCYRNQKDYVDS